MFECFPTTTGPTSTLSDRIATVTTDTEGSEVPCSDDEKPCSGTAIPTSRDASVVTAIPTSKDVSMVAETSTVFRTAVTTQPVRTDSSSITTAIIGTAIAAAIVVVLLLVGTSGLCVVVHRKTFSTRAETDPVYDTPDGVADSHFIMTLSRGETDPVYDTPGCVADSHFIMTPSAAYSVREPLQLPDVTTANSAYGVLTPVGHEVPDT